MRRHRLLVLPVAGILLGAVTAPLALAQESGDRVVHRQSVLTEVDATGDAGTSRVFTQLTVPGSGSVELPGQATSGLRGLSGSGPDVDGDTVRFGAGTARTVANNTAELPVSIEIRYAIDGETVDARDVVGHDGEVAVTYVVRNLTATPTELTLVDGDGEEVTETVDVAVPMVGSLSMTLPSAFRDVVAPGGVVVGDGRGGTVVNWSLLLFSPLGSETQEVTWTAQATDAVVPSASLQVLPVTPDSFGSLASTEAAYAGAVGSTTELTEGAREIDSNLRRLADGAGQLLSGLTQLRDGANELSTGLVTADEGANELSDGLGRARTGAGTLSAGLTDLANGAGRLSAGVGSARAGATELGSGLGDLSAGATQLSDGLTTAEAGGNELATGLGQLSAGAGDLADGAGDLAAGAATLDAKTGELVAGAGALSTGAAQVLGGIQLLQSSLTGPEGLPAALAGITQLKNGIGSAGTDGTLLNGLARLDGGLLLLSSTIADPDGQLRAGVGRIKLGLDNPGCSLATPSNPLNPCGVTQFNNVTIARANGIVADITAVLDQLDNIDTTGMTQGALDTLADIEAILDDSSLADPGTLQAAATIQTTAGGVATVVTNLQTGLDLIDQGLVTLADTIADPDEPLRTGVALLTAGVSNPACDLANPTNPANPCGLLQGLQALEIGLTDAATEVQAGLGSTSTEDTLLWGADQVAKGSSQLSAGATQLKAEGTAPLAAGAEQVSDGAGLVAGGAASAAAGSGELVDGLGRLAGGGLELSAGAARAAAGGSALSDGLGQLDAGAGELTAGAGRAAAGAVDLNNGLVQLDDGGQRLASGLGDAADGSQLLADGLGEATDGGDQIADGSEQLVEEGTTVLADSVSDATVSSSMQLEQVRAVAARGVAGDGLPYPTVEGADASAVFQFDLAGVGAEEGPGVAGRFGIGLIALLLAFGAGLLTRRRVLVLSDMEVPASDRTTV